VTNKDQSQDGQNIPIIDQKNLFAQEYHGIIKRTEDASTRRWQAAAFLVGGVIAAAGLIIARQSHGMETFIQTSILGIVIIFSLCLFRYWFLTRFDWRMESLYDRQDYLEEKLNFFTNRYIRTLDAIDNLARDALSFEREKESTRPKKELKRARECIPKVVLKVVLKVLVWMLNVLKLRGWRDRVADWLDDLGHDKENKRKAPKNAGKILKKRGILQGDTEWLDDILKKEPEELSECDRVCLKMLLKECEYRKGAERGFINFLAVAGILIWIGLIITEFVFWIKDY